MAGADTSLAADGYEIHRQVLPYDLVQELRAEADRVAAAVGSACVRHLRSQSSIFQALALCDSFLALIPDGSRPVRSILFDKTPSENWPVLWHQDLTIAVIKEHSIPGYGPWSNKAGSPHVQPPLSLLENMATIRLHLDDTPASNGALQIIPGSHRHGKISESALETFDKSQAITCECNAGDALIMSPLILHSSRRSEIPQRRRVIHFEYAQEDDLASELDWFE